MPPRRGCHPGAWPAPAGNEPGVVDSSVDVELAAVDVAVIVYIHHGDFRRRHLLAEARRHLARELRGRRAAPGLDNQIVDAAIGTYGVDVTAPRSPGRRPRPPGHTVYTAVWHSPSRNDDAQAPKGTAAGLSVHDRAVVTSDRFQVLLQASRVRAAGSALPGRAARTGEPSLAEQAAAAVLYEQSVFDDLAGDVQEDQDDDQEQEFVISPERRQWLQELQRRVGELARDAPKTKERKQRRGGTRATPPHRSGYRPRR